MQRQAGPIDLQLDLGREVSMKLRLVPAGRFVMGDIHGAPDEWTQTVVDIQAPFYLGQLEVTNRQYACFDPAHDSGYIEGRGKDRTTRGTPINGPDYPVVRISWNEALAFCQWLSQKSGYRCTLPTEAQWEWACRAGTDSAYAFGEYKPGKNNVANIADAGIAGWNYGRCEPGYSDGVPFSGPGGRYAPNAWGLHDMHGNVAEWCLSTYKPYPYRAQDGRDNPSTAGHESRPRRLVERHHVERHFGFSLAISALPAGLQRRLPRPGRYENQGRGRRHVGQVVNRRRPAGSLPRADADRQCRTIPAGRQRGACRRDGNWGHRSGSGGVAVGAVPRDRCERRRFRPAKRQRSVAGRRRVRRSDARRRRAVEFNAAADAASGARSPGGGPDRPVDPLGDKPRFAACCRKTVS